VGFGLELLTDLVQIDLAGSEDQGGSARAECHRLHAQAPGVEVYGGRDVCDGQHHIES
jgi:hypothetical protein